MNCHLATFLTILFLISCDTDYLTFIKEHDSVHSSVINSIGDKIKHIIDGTSTSNVIIRITSILNNRVPNLELSCRVNKLTKESEILSAKIFYQTERSEEVIKLTGTLKQGEEITFPESGITISYVGNNLEGYKIQTLFKGDNRPLSGQFWCELSNKNGEISTNRVEIQDIDYYSNNFQIAMEYRSLADISDADFPITLPCTNSKVDLPYYAQNIKPKIDWKICEVEPTVACYASTNTIEIPRHFDSRVLSDGTLVLLKSIAKNKNSLKPFGFFCKKDSFINNIFLGDNHRGINFNNNDRMITFERISEPHQKFKLREGRFDTPFVLFANYRSNRPLKWSRENGILDNFPSPSPHFLTFPTIITKDLSGKYYLGDNKEFTFDVEVIYEPSAVKPPPNIIYVTESKFAEISAEFLNADEYEYLINGKKKPFLHYKNLEGMNVVFQNTSNKVTYKASNLLKNRYESKSHVVTIIAKSPYGSVSTNTFINVLPVPDMEKALKNGLCNGNCLQVKDHIATCDFDLKPYSGLTTEISWFFNSHNISRSKAKGEIGEHLIVTNGNSLRITPIGNRTQLKEILQTSNIYCRLRIFEADKYLTREIFDSAYLPNKLHVKFFQNEIVQPAINSQMTWIASVVTALAIILLVALGIAWYCMRNRGETYLVNAYEKAIGNDPEAEFRDVSAFQIFERPDTVPMSNNNDFNDNDLDVTGQDDFLECDYSDEIMTKFNETGSFINGLYGDKTLPKRNIDELMDSRKSKKI